MYTLAIPKSQERRAVSYLKDNWIEFEDNNTGDGFVNLSFPNKDENEFRDIIMKLKAQGVTLIGADEELTEKKISKLSDLVKNIKNEIPNLTTEQKLRKLIRKTIRE
tara:strand:+ start:143 stop:463 length:321 start_codon:yes stop_codon:yes gene_type:complete